MYSWQTLTMARVEHGAPTSSHYQRKAVLDLLLAIGSAHFPEPHLNFHDVSGSHDLYLSWHVDGRSWSVTVDQEGLVEERAEGPDDVIEGKLNGIDSFKVEVRRRAHWLLLGYFPAS